MAEPDVLFERVGAVGLVTLNRPKALNALTRDMCVAMNAQLAAWAEDEAIRTVVVRGAGRAFCAGGDIRSLYESGRTGTPYAKQFYRDEYLLDATVAHYPKPYVALIGGIVMGGGVGISVHGTYRIADETTTFAMPETGIGLFPDVGGSYFLPRLSGELGTYLALTGARLKTDDTLFAGLATHFVPGGGQETLLTDLFRGRPAGEAIAAAGRSGGPAPIADRAVQINSAFAADSIDAVMGQLERDGSAWAKETIATILSKSPTATKLALRQVRKGRHLSFDDCMRMEFRMVSRVIAGHDFYEGVRATIIEKDNAPRWQPSDLSEVSEAAVEAYFAPLPGEELPL